MKFLSNVRLLFVALWLGAAVFFIAVAQSSFAVLPSRELAGSVVSRTLMVLNLSGLVLGSVLLLTSFIKQPEINRFRVWGERFLLLILSQAAPSDNLSSGCGYRSSARKSGDRLTKLLPTIRSKFSLTISINIRFGC